MNKKSWSIAKINLRTMTVPYWIAGAFFVSLLVQSIVQFIIFQNEPGFGADISTANVLWLVLLLAAILVPARNFRRVMNLGGKRDNFLMGSLAFYVVLAGATALLTNTLHFTVEQLFERHTYFDPSFGGGIANLAELFGWADNGFVVSVLQQFAFLLLAACVFHTLTAMQDKWYGWVTDAVIIAIISVFTPIAPLRAALAWFFSLIMFREPWLQIPACLVLACAIFALNKPLLARKAI